MRTRLLAAAVVAILLIVSASTAYWQWRQRQVPEAVVPLVKNATLRVANSLTHELQPSNITYGELFETLGKHVTEIDSKLIDVQTLETLRNRRSVDPALAYMRAVQDVLRAQQMLYRKQLEASTALESMRDAYAELRGTSSYSYDYARKSAERAEERASKASSEYSEARDTFRRAVETMAKTRTRAAEVIPGDALCEPSLPAKVLEKIAKDKAA